MTYTLNNSTSYQEFSSEFFDRILKVIQTVLKIESDKAQLSVNIATEPKMSEMNSHRDKEGPTDVLSFPLNNWSHDQAVEKINLWENTDQSDSMELGDIFLCPDYIEKKYGKESLHKKMTLLTIHGMLHLLGYDHEISESDEKLMNEMQDKVLSELE